MFGVMRTFRAARVPADAVLGPTSSNRFIGGLSGRCGTSWMARTVHQLLGPDWASLGEHGSFSLSQVRKAAEDLYQATPGTAAQRDAFLRYFRRFAMGPAARRRRIYGDGLRGWGRLVPRRGLLLAHERLREQALAARTLDEVYEAFGRYYSGLLDFAAYLRVGAVDWISKEPSYGRHLDDLHRMIPDCRVVVMVRDGGDVALSMSRRGWEEGDVRRCIDRWRAFAAQALAAFQCVPAENVLRVRYESMVDNPRSTLRDVLAFYGVDDPDARLAATAIEAPKVGNYGKWKGEFAPPDVRYFEERCGELMKRLGYPS